MWPSLFLTYTYICSRADTGKDVQWFLLLCHFYPTLFVLCREKGVLACLIVYVWVKRNRVSERHGRVCYVVMWNTAWWWERRAKLMVKGERKLFGRQVRESSRGLVGYSLCMHSPSVQFLDWSTMPSQSFPPFLGAGALHSLLLQWVHSVPQVDHLLHSVHRPSTATQQTGQARVEWTKWQMREMETNKSAWVGERIRDRDNGRYVGERHTHTHVRVEAQTERNMQTRSCIIFYVFSFCAPIPFPPTSKWAYCNFVPYLGREDYTPASGCLALHRWRRRWAGPGWCSCVCVFGNRDHSGCYTLTTLSMSTIRHSLEYTEIKHITQTDPCLFSQLILGRLLRNGNLYSISKNNLQSALQKGHKTNKTHRSGWNKIHIK